MTISGGKSDIAISRDIHSGRFVLATSSGVYRLRDWTWGERKALVRDALVQGRFDGNRFIDRFLQTMIDPVVEPEMRSAVVATALELLAFPRPSSCVPLAQAQALLAIRPGWKISEMDSQPARDLDELLLSYFPAVNAAPDTTPDDGWTRIVIADSPGNTVLSENADPLLIRIQAALKSLEAFSDAVPGETDGVSAIEAHLPSGDLKKNAIDSPQLDGNISHITDKDEAPTQKPPVALRNDAGIQGRQQVSGIPDNAAALHPVSDQAPMRRTAFRLKRASLPDTTRAGNNPAASAIRVGMFSSPGADRTEDAESAADKGSPAPASTRAEISNQEMLRSLAADNLQPQMGSTAEFPVIPAMRSEFFKDPFAAEDAVLSNASPAGLILPSRIARESPIQNTAAGYAEKTTKPVSGSGSVAAIVTESGSKQSEARSGMSLMKSPVVESFKAGSPEAGSINRETIHNEANAASGKASLLPQRFDLSDLEEHIADILERASLESGVDLL
jgi:hypothetical protein